MKIGLIDVDGHNFPNLALMRISAWHMSWSTTNRTRRKRLLICSAGATTR